MAARDRSERGRTGQADEWVPRGAMRGLLWWPPVAFVLALAAPGLWLPWVAVSGLVLAGVGAGGTLVASRRRRAPDATPITAPAAAPAPLHRAA